MRTAEKRLDFLKIVEANNKGELPFNIEVEKDDFASVMELKKGDSLVAFLVRRFDGKRNTYVRDENCYKSLMNEYPNLCTGE